MYDFLWDKKNDKIKRTQMCLKLQPGWAKNGQYRRILSNP